jgi:hypothetical protein
MMERGSEIELCAILHVTSLQLVVIVTGTYNYLNDVYSSPSLVAVYIGILPMSRYKGI